MLFKVTRHGQGRLPYIPILIQVQHTYIKNYNTLKALLVQIEKSLLDKLQITNQGKISALDLECTLLSNNVNKQKKVLVLVLNNGQQLQQNLIGQGPFCIAFMITMKLHSLYSQLQDYNMAVNSN